MSSFLCLPVRGSQTYFKEKNFKTIFLFSTVIFAEVFSDFIMVGKTSKFYHLENSKW